MAQASPTGPVGPALFPQPSMAKTSDADREVAADDFEREGGISLETDEVESVAPPSEAATLTSV